MNFTFYDQYQPVKPSFTGKQLSIGGTICEEQIYSKYIFERARKVNIYFSTLIIVVGIIGNALALFVFSQKKFRVNSSSVYMLCLALSDGLFLLTHFFEDTLRTYIDLYVNKNINVHEQCRNHSYFEVYNISKECESNLSPHSQRFIRSLNITDRFDFFCVLFNYFRYFLRFLSAYIIVAFTINRVITMYRPVTEIKLESKKITWTIISVIVFLGLISNIWVIFSKQFRKSSFLISCPNHKRYLFYFVLKYSVVAQATCRSNTVTFEPIINSPTLQLPYCTYLLSCSYRS